MSNDTTSKVPHVVILGAGYAGALCTRSLEAAVKNGHVRVTVLERRDGMHHKIGSIRASVLGGEHIDRVRIPFARIFSFAKLVECDIESIDPQTQTVKLRRNDNPIHYDILLCATGQASQCIGDLPPSVRGKDQVRTYFKSTSDVIRASQNIVIAGGGPSAIEFAGEIRAQFSDKKITIVCSSAHLLSSSVSRPPAKFFRSVYKLLVEQNIGLIRGEKVISPTPSDFPADQKYLAQPGLQIKTDSGHVLECDLLLWVFVLSTLLHRY